MCKFDFTKEIAFILHLHVLTAGFRKSHLEPHITSPLGYEERGCKY